ncbi:MAG TPA: integrase arm-type DNA-binding domain-containing protein [Trueperaceae bacterium]
MPLTDTALRAVKPRSTRYELQDRDGLLLEVLPSGRMTWRYRYTLAGKREKVTLGRYPALSLAQARKRRNEAAELIEQGLSPAREKKRERETGPVATFADVAERWVTDVLRPASKAAKQDETYLRRDCLPRIGWMAPAEVTTANVRACVDAVLTRGHGQAARRVRNVLKRVFEYAEGLGVVRGNPASVVRPAHIAPTRSRKRTLSPDEIRTFLDALHTSSLSRQSKLALHFLLLVPARKGELVNARWENVDLEAGTWDIPASDSKNGAPIRHQLPRQALEILRELRGLTTTQWVLPSNRKLGKSPVSVSQLNTAMGTIAGLPVGLVIHDLRRTVRTGLGELGGVPEVVAELCLNHRPKGVAGVYDRSERLEERAVALQRWADRVDALCATGPNVTPIRRTA